MMACSRTFSCLARRRVLVVPAFVFLVALAATQLNAQDPILSELYGRGVHQYFAGHYAEAHELLDLTIKEGDQDPRAYYFRGLSYNRLGRPDEAQTDFAHAAELEVANAQSAFNVGRALERIQGSERLVIERVRRMARVAARSKTKRKNRARYERFQEGESRALRGSSTRPAAPPIPPAPPREGEPAPTPDPFDPGGLGSSKATPAQPPAKKPMPVAPEDDPFGDDSDPFGDAPAPKPAVPPAATDVPPAAADDDPFGDAPAPKPAVPPAATDVPPSAVPPSAVPPAAADDDPFG